MTRLLADAFFTVLLLTVVIAREVRHPAPVVVG
jgi:hypothetical protein